MLHKVSRILLSRAATLHNFDVSSTSLEIAIILRFCFSVFLSTTDNIRDDNVIDLSLHVTNCRDRAFCRGNIYVAGKEGEKFFNKLRYI